MTSKNNFKTFYALSLAWQLGFFISIPISGFMFLGFWIDDFFESKPLFLIIGLFVGLTITIYEVYHLIILLIKDKNNA